MLDASTQTVADSGWPTPNSFEPSPAQLARRKALRRYNWLTLYGPLLLLTLIGLGVLAALIWATIERGTAEMERWRTFVSAAADTVIILTSIGMTLACVVIPAAAVATLVYGRQQAWRPLATTQRFLWRVDQYVTTAQERVDQVAAQSAEKVIDGRSRLAYWESLLKWFRYWLIGR